MPELVDLARTLYTSRNPTRRWLHNTRREWVEESLRREANSGSGRALEIGPGSGVYLPLLCELFDQVTASDVESQYLEHLDGVRHRPNLELVVDDITRSALEPSSFDVVLCSEVIEHTGDPAGTVASLSRLVRPGGSLVLTTPQARSTLELAGKIAFLPGIIHLVRAVYREPVLPTGHISLLTAKQLRRLLDARGFRVREHWTYGLYLPLLAELGGETGLRLQRRLERRVRGGPLGGLLWIQCWVADRLAG